MCVFFFSQRQHTPTAVDVAGDTIRPTDSEYRYVANKPIINVSQGNRYVRTGSRTWYCRRPLEDAFFATKTMVGKYGVVNHLCRSSVSAQRTSSSTGRIGPRCTRAVRLVSFNHFHADINLLLYIIPSHNQAVVVALVMVTFPVGRPQEGVTTDPRTRVTAHAYTRTILEAGSLVGNGEGANAERCMRLWKHMYRVEIFPKPPFSYECAPLWVSRKSTRKFAPGDGCVILLFGSLTLWGPIYSDFFSSAARQQRLMRLMFLQPKATTRY